MLKIVTAPTACPVAMPSESMGREGLETLLSLGKALARHYVTRLWSPGRAASCIQERREKRGDEIVCVGVGAVSVGRVGKLLERYEERFARRILSAEEAEFCARSRTKRRRAFETARCFAAKEALVKALTGIGAAVDRSAISVLYEPNGSPRVRWHGALGELVRTHRLNARVAVSHVGDQLLALAVVIRT